MASGFDRTALAILFIALVRNLKKDFRQHRSFQEQIDYWVDVVKDLDPKEDAFASGIRATSELYKRHGESIDKMHLAIADVLTKLADPSQTGGFQWSNCSFVTFKDILDIAGRSELAGPSIDEIVEALKRRRATDSADNYPR